MKKIIQYILILIILVIIFIFLIFYKSKKNVLDDIIIFGLWNDSISKNEYEITLQDKIEINVFSTINNKKYKKIAPGSKGSFVIKFKRPRNSIYKINIKEKTAKPQNLIFIFENKKYSSIEQIENSINQKFINNEKITINWEWKYYINEKMDEQDTRDGEKVQSYIFEIEAIIEDQERKENEI